MKNIRILFTFIFLAGLFASCQEDMLELGDLPSAGELKFDISQNPNDPNMVILESQTPDVIPFWSHPMGRSTRVRDTVKLAFPGTYKFVYGVQSGAGLVTADTVTLEITTTNLSYVEDPLWNNLTGGVGESKTWLLDLNADGVSKYFDGPMYFFGTDNGWMGECLVEGGDCWNWSPEWAGNQWIATAGDYGQMTFSLEGNAQLTVDHQMLPARGVETGTYFLDVDNHILTTTDATPLHTAENEDCAETWSSARVFSLTEDYMQLGFLRKSSCDGAALLVFNYISQEYAENWVPDDQPDPEPELPDGWYDDVTSIVETELKWVLSPETPFNWTGLDGAFLNNWTAVEDYPDWSGFNASVPATYANFSLVMDSQDSTVEYVAPDGSVTTGTFTLDGDGVFTFDGINPSFDIGSAIDFNTTAENQLRILKIEKQAGAVTGMWVGAKDPEKPEYLAYHLILDSKGNDDGKVEGTEVAFDNSKLIIGDLEGKGNLRLELYNDFGSTKTDPPLDHTAVVFDDRVEITFTIQGITLVDGAAGSYNTAIGVADADWSAQYWGDGTGAGEVAVTGDGTYTVYAEPGSTFDTALVFVVDILGLASDLQDISAVTVSIDSVVIY